MELLTRSLTVKLPAMFPSGLLNGISKSNEGFRLDYTRRILGSGVPRAPYSYII